VDLDEDKHVLVQCGLGLQLVTHLLSSNVFRPAFNLIKDPTFINRLIIYTLVKFHGVDINVELEKKWDCLTDLPTFDTKKADASDRERRKEDEKKVPLPNCKRTLTTALGNALQTTAGPLLPQDLQFSAFPLIKMWPSPTKKLNVKKKYLLKKSYSFDFSSSDALLQVAQVAVPESASISNFPSLLEDTFHKSLDDNSKDSFSLQSSPISSCPSSDKGDLTFYFV
jgi:hypothetical protein